ncbi:MAG: isoamylase early set domain-containing protein [Bacteroidetes bacterium]|nr:isoamylase early set domain-containing protein [Bacteroidota bacterium]MBS1757964.1 isoamylase early set domain-containing protein [Bacteroidota bacterium]
MKKKVTFTLPAEALADATEALLLGDFNDWNAEKGIVLKKQKDGSFKVSTQLETGRSYQYRFLLNDGRWVNDYNAQNYVPVSGYEIENCIITVDEVLDVNPKPKKETKPKAPAKKKVAVKEAGPKAAAKPKVAKEKTTAAK